MGVRCFYVTPAGRSRRYLRRYSGGETTTCPGMGYHNAQVELDVIEEHRGEDGYYRAAGEWDPADPRWPTKCEACDYLFTDADPKQLFHDHLWIDSQGKLHSIRDRVPGMMWNAWWMPEAYRGPDGLCLVVRCPNGDEWMIDSRASNCTMPNDWGPFGQAHRCWVRHGTPPDITVDKNGKTCGAGGGSIQAGNYHGFLKAGTFEP